MNRIKVKLNLDNVQDFVKVSQSFKSDIDIRKGKYVIDAKSILGVMSIDCSEGVIVEIVTSNEKELVRFIEEMKRFE